EGKRQPSRADAGESGPSPEPRPRSPRAAARGRRWGRSRGETRAECAPRQPAQPSPLSPGSWEPCTEGRTLAHLRVPVLLPGGAALCPTNRRCARREKAVPARPNEQPEKRRSLRDKMAPSVVLRSFSRLLAPARLPSCSSTRSKFYVREPVNAKPNWLAVGLSVGASVFMWIYVSTLLTESPGAEVTDIFELLVVGPGDQTWVLCKQYMLLTAKPSLRLQVHPHF
uniref:NADH dehydrogenase [ubiquinone] 1 subunit C1, mitochondrial n=2 Tax=Mus spicilegus TaxID=10103 RepID=A0A8C6H1A4_MUSSI